MISEKADRSEDSFNERVVRNEGDLKAEVEQRKTAIRDLAKQIQIWRKAERRALKLQAQANDVHFTALNGEGKRIRSVQAASVSADVYTSDKERASDALASVAAAAHAESAALAAIVASNTKSIERQQTQAATYAKVYAAGLGLLGLLVVVVNYLTGK